MSIPKSLLVIIIILSVACASTPSNARLSLMINNELATNTLERNEHLKLGRVSLSLVRALLRFAEEDLNPDETALVKSLRSVEVSSYSINPPLARGQSFPVAQVEASLHTRGWSRMIRTHEDNDQVMLLTRADDEGKINGIFVLSADKYEVELVQIEGRLNDFFANAIADDPYLINGILGS